MKTNYYKPSKVSTAKPVKIKYNKSPHPNFDWLDLLPWPIQGIAVILLGIGAVALSILVFGINLIGIFMALFSLGIVVGGIWLIIHGKD